MVSKDAGGFSGHTKASRFSKPKSSERAVEIALTQIERNLCCANIARIRENLGRREPLVRVRIVKPATSDFCDPVFAIDRLIGSHCTCSKRRSHREGLDR